MKTTTLLVLLLCNIGFAQISESDFKIAIELLQGNNPEKALANLAVLEKKFPVDAKVLALRGFAHFQQDNYNAAMMSITNSIKTDPKYVFAYVARAQMFSTKGMFDRAISDISEAIKLEPQNVDLLVARSGYYYKNKQFAEGLADMKTKIKLNPNSIMGYFDAAVFAKEMDINYNSDSFFSQAYANTEIPKYATDAFFAKFLLRFGSYEEAKIKYEAALLVAEKYFDDDDFHNVGIVYYKTKNLDKAVLYFNKAIAKNADNVAYYNNPNGVYTDLKQWQKVKETAQSALAVDANSPMANMYMAIGLKFTGNTSLSAEYEAKAKQLEAELNKQ